MKLQCVCGKVLNNIPDSMAGERIRCKECGKVMTIRSPSTSDAGPARSDDTDPLAVKGHRKCSGCGRSYPMRDRVCTACGIDMDTGAALYTSLDASGESTRQKPGAPRAGLVARLLRFMGMKGH